MTADRRGGDEAGPADPEADDRPGRDADDRPVTGAGSDGPPGEDGDGADRPAEGREGRAVDPVLDELFAVVEDRRDRLPPDSYTASLFDHEKGENAVLEKLGEETTELVLAAKDDDREAVLAESADLVYHLLVLLAAEDLTVEDLRRELRKRR